ncbi:MAG: hypothetical protein KAT70_07980, partial [Thermoplasmata archaeon]|nr:hypothetical protein [Thermoplasmata archaeon]
GEIWDLWNLKFTGIEKNGMDYNLVEAKNDSIVSGILLVMIMVAEAMAAAFLFFRKRFDVTSRQVISLLVMGATISGFLLYFLSFHALQRLEFPTLFSTAEGMAPGEIPLDLYSGPGIAWFLLLVSLVLLLVSAFFVWKMSKLEAEDEENPEDEGSSEDEENSEDE